MEKIAQQAETSIVYNGDLVRDDPFSLFDLRQQERRGNIIGFLGGCGRGDAAIVQHSDRNWLVKHYWRGGLAARISEDRYVGLRRGGSRSWREWRLLQELRSLQLPVPAPLAARVQQGYVTYSADLITEHLPHTQTLFHRLLIEPLPGEVWERVGRCIRRFHDHNVCHADLNANNILLARNAAIYLIDFDRCGFRRGGSWRQRNLKRLRASLDKLHKRHPGMHFASGNWRELLAGYHRSPEPYGEVVLP